ncbi:formimidoylglutamase [Flavobacterium sp. CS20]|jgi:formiminoglutamase|uniref:formimidoylglutamase n=1 Tax=Flavobacterium sp. CS20 TaxID=2775246 RepID=UPI001B3A5994|nr:formimidoylglutamase [Flavobacterium sp. CS20]QTY27495.1 formimidoylglutamase [Flavobacterium sp. CS20]
MNRLRYLDKSQIETYVKPRHGETKLGEHLELLEDINDLENQTQDYVILGLPEDIGVRANHGKAGASKTWTAFLESFLNIQHNRFNSAENVVILGHLNFEDLLDQADQLDPNHNDYHVFLSDLVEQIDEQVYEVVKQIISFGKTPIVIGGGHNNAYGIIKACSYNEENPINVLNIDAHTDLRHCKHRHSGNGFSYAIQNGFLDKYYIFGLHKNYTPEYIFEYIDKKHQIDYCCFDQLLHLNELEKLSKLKAGCNFLMNNFGLEIDCDSIQNFNSSAKTPSGFSIDEIRNMIKMLKTDPLKYIHICEAIPSSTTGKALSYFVSDLIRNID